MVMVRDPVVAGRFYPGQAAACESEVSEYTRLDENDAQKITGKALGGIVPHAGWVCSGRVAGRVLATIHAASSPATVILLGAMHQVRGKTGLLFPAGQWRTPLGAVEIDARFAERLLSNTNQIEEDPFSHEGEHSLEVQLPFIQRLFPDAKILPILVPPAEQATAIGEAVGRTVIDYNAEAVVIGSTDLTHYGPAYGFAPQGTGAEGLQWAKNVNDRRVVDKMLDLDAEGIIPEVAEHHNACGPGAVAATIAAVRRMGATRPTLIAHTTSAEVLGDRGPGGAVGYAGIVYS